MIKIRSKETCVVLEQAKSSWRITSAVFGEDNSVDIISQHKFSDINFSRFNKKFDKAVVALDSQNSATIESVVTVGRAEPGIAIKEGELDNLIFKGLWEFLNEHRPNSFKKLKISDLDLILARIDIINVLVDNHHVIDPINLRGRHLSLHFRGTFVPRGVLPLLEKVSKITRDLAVVERFAIASSFIGNEARVVHCGLNESSIFSGGKISKFKKSFSWRLEPLVSITSSVLSVCEADASLILDRYLMGHISKRLRLFLSPTIDKHIDELQALIKKMVGKKNDTIYINTPYSLWLAIGDIDGVLRADIEQLAVLKGFQINKKYKEDIWSTKENIALLCHPIFTNHFQDMDKMLQRRARWLVPKI